MLTLFSSPNSHFDISHAVYIIRYVEHVNCLQNTLVIEHINYVGNKRLTFWLLQHKHLIHCFIFQLYQGTQHKSHPKLKSESKSAVKEYKNSLKFY